MRARSAGGGVEVEVADDGEGIPAGDDERVFEAFYRGDAARGEDGAGLGLAISRAIVEAHGGRIWLEAGLPRHPGPLHPSRGLEGKGPEELLRGGVGGVTPDFSQTEPSHGHQGEPELAEGRHLTLR